ncbi:hypothetical protein ZOSMA_166G00060 [Zostera marina]|uniref:Uncharacterized protein n=1 Tax=Zostera marina TaxID=29655 RepID=A0A0K9PVP4_ZOSMR|nr:hypothetical protein ZOSMA_166G00060 [Zostera marina]
MEKYHRHDNARHVSRNPQDNVRTWHHSVSLSLSMTERAKKDHIDMSMISDHFT